MSKEKGLWERKDKQGRVIAYYSNLTHPVTRRQVRVSLGRNKKLALDCLAKLKVDLMTDKFNLPKRRKVPTFAEFAAEYLKAEKARGKKSWKDNVRCVQNLLPTFGGLQLNRITKAMAYKHLEKRVQDRVMPPIRGRFANPENLKEWERRNESRRISNRHANSDIRTLRAVLYRAVRDEIMDHNPIARIKLLDERAGDRKRYLLPHEAKALWREVNRSQSSVLRDVVDLALNTGRRRGDLLTLKWGQVDLENGMLRFPKTKAGIEQHAPLPTPSKEALLRRLAAAEARGFKNEYVFPGRDGRGHCKTIHRAFQRALERAGIKDFRFHDTRHTVASMMLMGGIDPKTIAENLGHTTMQQVQQRYGHVSLMHRKAAAETLAETMTQMMGRADAEKPKDGGDGEAGGAVLGADTDGKGPKSGDQHKTATPRGGDEKPAGNYCGKLSESPATNELRHYSL